MVNLVAGVVLSPTGVYKQNVPRVVAWELADYVQRQMVKRSTVLLGGGSAKISMGKFLHAAEL